MPYLLEKVALSWLIGFAWTAFVCEFFYFSLLEKAVDFFLTSWKLVDSKKSSTL